MLTEPLTLVLPFAPSVNHYYRHVGDKVLISSEGRRYRQTVAEACMVQLVGVCRPMTGRLAVTLWAFPPDRRIRDIDNIFKALGDALQHANVYENDGQIDELRLLRGAVVAGGKLEVTIWEVAPQPPGRTASADST